MKPIRVVYLFLLLLTSLIYAPADCKPIIKTAPIVGALFIVSGQNTVVNALFYAITAQTDTTATVNSESSSRQREDSSIGESPAETARPPAENKYALITTGPARVLKELSPDSPIIGMANRGKHYPLILIGKSWCTIQYGDEKGWIERQYIEIVDQPTKSFVIRELLLVIAGIVVVVLIAVIIFVTGKNKNKIKNEWFLAENKRKKIIIISNKETQVQRHLTNTTTSLDKCFSELGFEIKKAVDSNTAMKMIYHYLSDAIIVDWQLGNNTQTVMEQILSGRSDTSNTFVLFYNVNNPETVEKSVSIPNANYLGISFTDRELFNIITPLLITGKQRQSIRKSIEASALQGDLSESSLSEIFQFIEIGKKTGSLLVEDEKPVGIVYFKDGIIIYAAGKHSTGKKAVIDILRLQQGQFQFVLDRHPKSPNCSIPTLEILMEWTKECDETSRHRLRAT